MIASAYFDTVHMILDCMPYLATTARESDGSVILHSQSIYESRSPLLVEESVKIVSRYNDECASVANLQAWSPLHSLVSSSCTVDISEVKQKKSHFMFFF